MAGNNTLQQRLDAYVAGQCSQRALTEELLAHCAAVPRASWEVLALLDQYQRRGKLPRDLQRSISQSIQRRALGMNEGAAGTLDHALDAHDRMREQYAREVHTRDMHDSEPVRVGQRIDLTQLEAANQGEMRPPTRRWPARSVQLMSVVAFMLATSASQGLGEHENATVLQFRPAPVHVATPGQLALAADMFIVQPDAERALITVARNAGSDGEVGFNWWTQAAGARPGADYRGQSATRVSMPSGANVLQLTVPIRRNPARHHTEFFYVAIGDPTGGAQLGEVRRAAVFILPR